MTLGSNEYTAHAAVIEGVVEALDLLKKRNAGRYTTQDRITQEVLLGAAVGVAKGKVLSSVARLLNVANRSQTALANGRVEVYESEFLCVVDRGLGALGRVLSSSVEWRCGGGELVVASSVLCRAW